MSSQSKSRRMVNGYMGEDNRVKAWLWEGVSGLHGEFVQDGMVAAHTVVRLHMVIESAGHGPPPPWQPQVPAQVRLGAVAPSMDVGSRVSPAPCYQSMEGRNKCVPRQANKKSGNIWEVRAVGVVVRNHRASSGIYQQVGELAQQASGVGTVSVTGRIQKIVWQVPRNAVFGRGINAESPMVYSGRCLVSVILNNGSRRQARYGGRRRPPAVMVRHGMQARMFLVVRGV